VVAFANRKYVESRGLIVYDRNLAVKVCFFRSQLDGYNTVSEGAVELSAVDTVNA
jgi:hypothetical protein